MDVKQGSRSKKGGGKTQRKQRKQKEKERNMKQFAPAGEQQAVANADAPNDDLDGESEEDTQQASNSAVRSTSSASTSSASSVPPQPHTFEAKLLFLIHTTSCVFVLIVFIFILCICLVAGCLDSVVFFFCFDSCVLCLLLFLLIFPIRTSFLASRFNFCEPRCFCVRSTSQRKSVCKYSRESKYKCTTTAMHMCELYGSTGSRHCICVDVFAFLRTSSRRSTPNGHTSTATTAASSGYA